MANNIHQLNVTVIKSAGKDHTDALAKTFDLAPMIKEAVRRGAFKALELRVANSGKKSLIAQTCFKSTVAGLGEVQVNYLTAVIGSGELTDAEKAKVMASAGKGNAKTVNASKCLLDLVEQGSFSEVAPRVSQSGSLSFFVSAKGNVEVGATPIGQLKKATAGEDKAALLRALM